MFVLIRFILLFILFSGKILSEVIRYRIDSEANVRRAFCNVLERCPSSVELQTYSAAYPLPGGHMNELVRQLAMFPEFEGKYIMNNPLAVDMIFLRIMGRPPNPEGRSKWQKALNESGYKFVVNHLIDSKEYKQKYGTVLIPGDWTCVGC